MGHPVERYKEVLHGGGGDGREGWISILLKYHIHITTNYMSSPLCI